MSAIAHWLEQAGISTVVIGLIQLHLEKMHPPRALWVPFELGRPCGAPSNPEFQHEVLLQALQLISNADEPTLQAFATDDPRSEPNDQWLPPDNWQAGLASAQNITDETQLLKQDYQRVCVRQSRTSFGIAKTPMADLAELFDSIYEQKELKSVREDVSAKIMFKLATDDLKAYYTEAGLSSQHKPNSTQIHDWLWKETLFGQRMRELRKYFMQSDDAKIASYGEKFIVPHRWRD